MKKVLIALIQRPRNIQTIIDALASIIHVRELHDWMRNLVQIILHRKVLRTPTVAPTRQTPYDHARCNLYTTAHMNRGTIKGGSLFSPVCLIFNHSAQHTKHIERAITSCPRLQVSLSKWTFLPDRQPAIITTATLLNTLRTQTAQNIAPLL